MKRGTDLQNHVFDTYISLRRGTAGLALAFPLVVPLVGWLHGSHLKGSLSAYFCESPGTGEADGFVAARTVFVGILFAVGTALYLYKGFSNLENYLLNIAGAGAYLVALIPTPCDTEGYTLTIFAWTLRGITVHGTAAVSLFVCVALVCLLCSGDTLAEIPTPTARAWYTRAYKFLGILMLGLPLATVFLTVVLQKDGLKVLAAEAAGSLVFGSYWLLKSIELSHSGAQKKATQGLV